MVAAEVVGIRQNVGIGGVLSVLAKACACQQGSTSIV